MTAQQYIDEVKTRIGRSYANDRFSDLYILSVINKARRNIQFATLELLQEHYTVAIDIPLNSQPMDLVYSDIINYNGDQIYVYRIQLPANFIDLVEAWVYFDNITDVSYINCLQVRVVSKREFIYTLQHTYNTATFNQPLAHIEHNIADASYILHLAISRELYNFENFNNSGTLRIFYLYLIDDLGNEAIIIDGGGWHRIITPPIEEDPQLPPQLEELVILRAVVDILSLTDESNYLQRVKDELQMYYHILEENYQIRYIMETTIPSKLSLQEASWDLTFGEKNGLQKEG